MTKIWITGEKQVNWLVKWFLPFCLLALLPSSMQAQVNNNKVENQEEDVEEIDDEEDEDDEDASTDFTVPVEDELTVTDKEGNEELIDFPEAMTYDLDSLLNLYMSKTYLGTPGDCEMKNENPTYPKEVYIERLQRLPTVMEMAYNDIVQRFIDRYCGRLRYSVSYMLGAFNFYVPIFEEALEAYQVPLDAWVLLVSGSLCRLQENNMAWRSTRSLMSAATP